MRYMIYALLAVVLFAAGFCVAGALGALNTKYVPYVVGDAEPEHELLDVAPIQITPEDT